MQLYIGNKNYSSWSMRPWVFMRQAGIAFDEVMVRIDGYGPDSQFKRDIASVNSAGKVPALVDGDLTVWDSLAIAEYLAEAHPQSGVWPQNAAHRAQARSVCAEMHSGFSALRTHCTMNIEADLSAAGERIWAEQAGVRADVARISELWTGLLAQHGGPCLFGSFTMVDAYFAPVVMRLTRYGLPVAPCIADYMQHIQTLDGVQAWVAGALAEHDFLAVNEPYRQHR